MSQVSRQRPSSTKKAAQSKPKHCSTLTPRSPRPRSRFVARSNYEHREGGRSVQREAFINVQFVPPQ
jgi:hypothetical protein